MSTPLDRLSGWAARLSDEDIPARVRELAASQLLSQLAGGVAGRLASTGAPARRWADAFGIALAMPNWPLMRAFLDSDARLLNTLTPVRTAMDACDAAEAGLHGAPDLLEHPDGFLA